MSESIESIAPWAIMGTVVEFVDDVRIDCPLGDHGYGRRVQTRWTTHHFVFYSRCSDAHFLRQRRTGRVLFRRRCLPGAVVTRNFCESDVQARSAPASNSGMVPVLRRRAPDRGWDMRASCVEFRNFRGHGSARLHHGSPRSLCPAVRLADLAGYRPTGWGRGRRGAFKLDRILPPVP